MNTMKRLALSGLAAASLAAVVGCKSEEAAPPAAPPAAAPAAAPSAPPAAAPAAAPAGGTAAAVPPAAAPANPLAGSAGSGNTIEGVVMFTGTAAAPAKLHTEADTKCPKNVLDEAVEVKDGKLANVWVHVTKGAKDGAGPAVKPVSVTQHGCMYKPRMQFTTVGTPITVKNEDDTLHNVHTFVGASTWFNSAMPGTAAAPLNKTPTDEGVIKWKCDVHPWMKGFVGVSKNGLQAISSDAGSFSIANVSAGKYTIEAWHEKFGTKTAEVTVEDGKPAHVEFKYDGTEKGS